MKTVNTSLDLRVRRTYKFLWDALMSLMTERDFEAISVTEICETAMVHRTTFYKHYEDKYGLLFQGIQDELNALFEAFDIAVNKPVEMDEEPITVAHLVTIFEHVQSRERFYRLILCGNGLSNFSTLFRKSLANRFNRRLQKDQKQQLIPIDLHTQVQAAAIVSMVTWWLENDCPYTPVEMMQYAGIHFNLVGSSYGNAH